MRILLIDDIRSIPEASVIARNSTEGFRALKEMGPWDKLVLDNDLGPGSDQGYHILYWLEANENAKFRPAAFEIISANPVARERMKIIANRIWPNYDFVNCEWWDNGNNY